MIDALSMYALITVPNQDLDKMSLANYERLANHFGAVQHMDADQDMTAKYRDKNKSPTSAMFKIRDRVNAAFPGQLAHMSDLVGSPAIATVMNVEPVREGKTAIVQGSERVRNNLLWHTDQDHERIPVNASIFVSEA